MSEKEGLCFTCLNCGTTYIANSFLAACPGHDDTEDTSEYLYAELQRRTTNQ